jgi:hypothetical protein
MATTALSEVDVEATDTTALSSKDSPPPELEDGSGKGSDDGPLNPVTTTDLIHLIRGRNHALRHYLSWRLRPDFRAIAPPKELPPDLIQIRRDNERLIAMAGHDGFKVHGGVLVNQRWNESPGGVAQARARNVAKYDIPDEEALGVQVPTAMPVEYLQELMRKRRTSAKLLRAALLAEKAKKAGEKPPELGLDKQSVPQGRDAVVLIVHMPLKYGRNTDRYIFDIRTGD